MPNLHCVRAITLLAVLVTFLSVALTGCSKPEQEAEPVAVTSPEPAPEPEPPPETAAPVEEVYDSDNDGVADSHDSCPNTPYGEYVDATGCIVYEEMAEATAGSANYPLFSFPAPRPSISMVGLNIADYYHDATLAALVNTIKTNLAAAGYADPSYYELDGMPGVAIATKLERIHKDGAPFTQPERWEFSDLTLNFANFNILDYLKALIRARPGYYRTIVILIKPKSYALLFGESLDDEEQVTALYTAGAPQPNAAQLSGVAKDFDISFLIYEVTRKAQGETAEQTELGISVTEHFNKTALNLWQ